MAAITTSVMFCDDIRFEISGKAILIGAYSGEIIVGQGPAIIALATWIQVEGLAMGAHSVKIRVVFDDGHQRVQVADLASGIEIQDESMPAIMTPTGLGLNIDRSGNVVLLIAFDGGEEVEVGRLRVNAVFAVKG